MPGDSTFGTLWKGLELYAPAMPPAILRQCVNNAHSRALAGYAWSQLRRAGAFSLAAPYTTGTSISVTNGSATVTGVATVWTSAAHAEKQLVIEAQAPFWDIASVESNTSLTLATPFVGTTGTYTTYAIQQIFLVMPSDFLHASSFLDVAQNWWPLSTEMTQESLDAYDPRRIITGPTPVQIVAARPSPFTSSLDQIRYELWPRPQGARVYFFRYNSKPPLMTTATEKIVFPLRGDVIRDGAMMYLSLVPGTEEGANPFYDASGGRSQAYERLFIEGTKLCRIEDQEISGTDISYRNEWKKLFPLPTGWPNFVPFVSGP